MPKEKKNLSNVTTENGLKQLTKTFEQPKRESKPSMNFKIQEKKKHYFSTLQVLIRNKKKKQPSTVHYVMKTISTNSFQK